MFLPLVQTKEEYEKLFRDDDKWNPAIQHLVHTYQLKGEIRRGALGSHIVYRVGNVWIKLMTPIFAGDMVYEISGLKTVEGKLSVPTPQILHTGELEGWKYVILSHVEGEPIKNIWPLLSRDQKLLLSKQMAEIIKEIGTCEPDSAVKNRFVWNDFIKDQHNRIREVQKIKGLPEPWLTQVEEFVHQIELPFFLTDKPIFMHADLTYDHFLVSSKENPQITGIIDMADCQLGRFEYELLAPICFIYKGQKELLRSFLLHCGYDQVLLSKDLSKKLMAWTILHRYCVLQRHFKAEMESCEAGNFEELAMVLFPL